MAVMDDINELSEQVPGAGDAADTQPPTTPAEAVESAEPAVPLEPAEPITSRFLFVDVAALRAKQLRRGAKVRYAAGEGAPVARKPERVAMEEVRRGLVYYEVPEPKTPSEAEA